MPSGSGVHEGNPLSGFGGSTGIGAMGFIGGASARMRPVSEGAGGTTVARMRPVSEGAGAGTAARMRPVSDVVAGARTCGGGCRGGGGARSGGSGAGCVTRAVA